MRLEISNVDKNLLGEIATLITGTEATIKVIKEEIKKEEKPKEGPKVEKPKEEPKVEKPKATKPREKNAFDTGSYVPWQEQWEDMMTAMNWGRR